MDFTFGLMVYNHQDYILDALESIKYQIEEYGVDYEIDLIITDDASQDLTVELIEKWITVHSNLFRKVKFLKNSSNYGVVYNFQRIIHEIKTIHFKIIAGDDLFSSNNLFEKFEYINDGTMLCFMQFSLENNNVSFNKRFLYRCNYNRNEVEKSHHNRLKAFRVGGLVHTPSVLYTKKLYENAECDTFNSSFKYIDDYPTWYAMIRNIDDLQIKYINDIVVLYRIHNASITHSNDMIHSLYNKENMKLEKLYFDEAKGFEKLRHWIILRYPRFKCKYMNITLYINYFYILRDYVYAFLSGQKIVKQYKKLQNIAARESKYYQNIKNNADRFYSDYFT